MKQLLLVLLFVPLVTIGQFKSLDKLTEADASDYLKLEGYRYEIQRNVESSGIIKWTGVDNSKPQKRMTFGFWPMGLGIAYRMKQHILTDDEISIQRWVNNLPSNLKLVERNPTSALAIDGVSIEQSKNTLGITRMSKPYFGNNFAFIIEERVLFGKPKGPEEISFVSLNGTKVFFTPQDTFDLPGMVSIFIKDYIQYLKGIGQSMSTINSIQNRIDRMDMNISFRQLKNKTVAVALGMDDNSKIEIVVNPDGWKNFSTSKRFYVLYHELGHDVFNLNHGNGGKMMYNYAEKDFSWDDFMSDRLKMFGSFNPNFFISKRSSKPPVSQNSTTVYNKSSTKTYSNNTSEADDSKSTIDLTYYKRAKTKFTSKDYMGAVTDMTVFINKYPNENAQAYYLRGIYRTWLDDYNSACDDWKKAADKGNSEAKIKLEKNCNPKGTYKKGANEWFNSGYAKYNSKDYKGAIEDFNRAVEIKSNDFMLYKWRGFSKTNIGDYKGSIEDFNKAIEIESNDFNLYFWRGASKSSIKDYEGAINDYDKAIKIKPNKFEIYRRRGYIKSSIKDYKGAILDLDKVIDAKTSIATNLDYQNRGISKYFSEDYNGSISDLKKVNEPSEISLFFLGTSNYRIKDYKNAIPYFDKVINLDGDNVKESYQFRGTSKLYLNDFEGAILDLDRSIELGLNESENYYQRALAKGQLKNYNGAIEDFSKSIEIMPDNASYYYGRAILFEIIKNYPNAIADLNKAIEFSTNVDYFFFKRAELKSQINDYEGSLNDYSKTVELNVNFPDVYFRRASVKYDLEDFEGAINDLTTVIDKDDKPYADVYKFRAEIKLISDDSKGALNDLNIALSIDPNDYELYVVRGSVKNNLDDFVGSIKDFNKSIELIDEPTALIYDQIASVRRESGDPKGAIEDYNKALSIDPNYTSSIGGRGTAKSYLKDMEGACADWNEALSQGDVFYKEKIDEFCLGMTKEKAIEKLKELKQLLELEVIKQEDYDKEKILLTPIILNKE
tara:strand:+ start:112 stop:3132 length:3021 start_codon:yes stop_codon:yes gene_type:complete